LRRASFEFKQLALYLIKNYDREIKGLVAALDFFKLKRGFLITFSQSDEIKVADKTIEVVSGLDFLYSDNFNL
jgi:hypothetical protein